MTINKSEFIEKLAARQSLTVSEAERIVNGMFNLVYEYLKAGNKVNFSGFGKFSVSHRLPRMGVNPRTMVPMTIPELNTPKFKAGEAFKQAVAIK